MGYSICPYMNCDKQVDELISSIYESVVSPGEWLRFLELLQLTFKDNLIALAYFDHRRHQAGVHHSVNMSPQQIQEYQNYYGSVDNLWAAAANHPRRGELLTRDELVPFPEMRRSEFYNDYLVRHGLPQQFGYTILTGSDFNASLTFCRAERFGTATEAEAHLLNTLLPHLQRAFRMHKHLDSVVAERDAAREALNRIPQAVIVLTLDGRPAITNRRAEDLLAEKDGLILTAGGITAADKLGRQCLNNALLAVQQPTQKGFFKTLLISRPSGKRSYEIVVMRNDVAPPLLGIPTPHIVIFVHDPDLRRVPSEQMLRDLFKLTPQEARLASQLMQGYSLEEAAEEQSVSYNTVKSHLMHLFQKTGVRRQSELLRLLLNSVAALTLSDGH